MKKKTTPKRRKKSDIEKLADSIAKSEKEKRDKAKLKKLKAEAIKSQKKRLNKDLSTGKKVLVAEDSPSSKDKVNDGGSKKVVQKIDLYEWSAPIRIMFAFEMNQFMIFVALALLFELYLAVLGHYALMFALMAFVFFVYVLGTTEPEEVSHTVTTRGIDSLGKLYEWDTLGDFWFSRRKDEYILRVETSLRVPSNLIMLVTKEDIQNIFLLLQDKLLYKDIRNQSWIDKKNFGDYIPMDKI